MQGIFGAIYSSQGISGGIGWFAHIGGFLTGAIMTWFVRRLKEHRKNVVRQ
jgi:membrane associated rhomboid family serine protease